MISVSLKKLRLALEREGVKTFPLRDFKRAVEAYISGWQAERDTPAGTALEIDVQGLRHLSLFHAGSRDYTLTLAEKKGPVNKYASTGRKLLTSADKDYD